MASSVSLIERLYTYEMKRARRANVELKLDKLNYKRTNIDWASIDERNSNNSGLNSAFSAMKFKWKKLIEEQYRLKTYTTIAGGNYTFFFVLPKIVAKLKEKYPNRKFKLALLEPEKKEDFYKYEPDVLLGAHFGESRRRFIGKTGKSHDLYRKMMDDEVFFYGSKKKLKEFNGNKKEMLEKDNLLYARLYVDDRMSERVLEYQFPVVPENRKKNTPRIVMDQMYATHEYMVQGQGIWIDCTSSQEKNDIVKLSEPLSHIKRYCFFAKRGDHNLNYNIAKEVFYEIKKVEKEGRKNEKNQ